MLMLTLLSLQAAEPTENLASKTLTETCHTGTAKDSEVVVCGRPEEQSPYRIGPQPATPPMLPNAEFRLSDSVEAKLSAEQGEIGGIPTNRAMITLKIKF